MGQASSDARPVGFIGLGLLGSALCERLLEAGYPLVVNNRTRSKAEPLVARGARWSDNPFAECDRVIVCLYTTAVVAEVLDEMQAGLRAGQIFIDTTTGDPVETTALGRRLAERGVKYLESPIAASSEQTRRGEALAMVAGPENAFVACHDLFACIAPKALHVGPWGSAAKVKLVNNLIVGLNRLALAEGLAFAKAIGLDAAKTLEVLQEGNAYSVAMRVKGSKMVTGDFSLQAKLAQHAKDVRIMLDEAARAGASLPLSELHLRLLDEAETAGWGELDNSAIVRVYERKAESRE
jgi:3-hydroxyisobutyrate dehydrogenase-like beta-hydroxyacid dehydrogenase